jgi:SAM-dependent methyltransferase
MPLYNRLKEYLTGSRRKETIPAAAYDIWSLTYDEQPENLVLAVDEEIVTEFFASADFESKIIADIGCGTGRHWPKIMDKKPGRLIGYDVSAGMLKKVKTKFPGAETCLLSGNELVGLETCSCDFIISTLTLAHIPFMEDAFRAWIKVLRPGGEIILTDFHPEALARGARRTFRHEGELVIVRNYAYSIQKLMTMARQLDLEVLRFKEIKINDSLKPFYQRQDAMADFDRFLGSPLIYGIHLKKSNAVI